MKNVTFNILKAIQNLRDAGFSESQASAIVGMMGDAFGATVTTKADLAALESRVYRFMVVQTGVTVGLIFAALFILIGGFGTFHRESASDAVQGQTSWRGLVVAPEQRCAPYDADDYQYPPLAPAVVRNLEEAGNQLLTFYEFPRAMWKSIRTTNALENLNREFRRRTKTQASFSSEESAVALLFGLIASGQIQLRRIDGYQRLSEVLKHAEVAA